VVMMKHVKGRANHLGCVLVLKISFQEAVCVYVCV